MQPEGRPQQGKLTTWNKKGIHAPGIDPRGLGIMQPWGALLAGNKTRKTSPDDVEDEGALM